jgi:hypothetical protein
MSCTAWLTGYKVDFNIHIYNKNSQSLSEKKRIIFQVKKLLPAKGAADAHT